MNWNNYDTKYIIKRLIIGFGMLILFTLLTTKRASALVLSENVNSYYQQWSSGQNSFERNWAKSNAPFKNISEGTIMFTFTVEGDITVREVYLDTWDQANNAGLLCSIGTTTYYNDSNTQVKLYTALCDVPAITQGIALIHLGGYAWNSGNVDMSSKMIYTNFQNQNDYNQAINDLVTNTGYMLTGMANIRNDIQHNEQAITAILNSLLNANNNGNTALQTAITNASNQAHQDAQDIKNTINNDNVDGANGDLDNFKNSSTFSDSTGLQAVLELPLNLVNSFTNTCQPISITIPWFDYTGTIPCMSTIYRQHFNGLYSVVALIVNAFFIYRILLKIYELVHNAKQPDEDKLEVIDL